MWIVIDMPEEDYNNIEPFLNGETIKGGINVFKALEIIKNGTPLDDVLGEIQAEIKTKYDSIPWRNTDYDDGWIEALEWVYDDVIDKYKEDIVRKMNDTNNKNV